jgi:hypothetical protein
MYLHFLHVIMVFLSTCTIELIPALPVNLVVSSDRGEYYGFD